MVPDYANGDPLRGRVIFTDGMTDAQNVVEEEFGDERLMDCCRTQFSVGTEQFDHTNSCCAGCQPLKKYERDSCLCRGAIKTSPRQLCHSAVVALAALLI